MLAEARQIGGIDDLGMLDPPAAVALVGVGELLDRVEHLRRWRASPIAWTATWKSSIAAAAHQVEQLVVGEEAEAAVARGCRV